MTTNTHELIEALKPFAELADILADIPMRGDAVTVELNASDLRRARQALAIQPQAEAPPGVGELAIDVLGDHLAESIEPFLGDRYPYESTNAGAAEIIETLKEAGLIITPAQPAGDVRERVAEIIREYALNAQTDDFGEEDPEKMADAILTALESAPQAGGDVRELGEHCENCRFWSQPVTPENCHSDDPESMGDCTHQAEPIAKATFRGDWCLLHRNSEDVKD